MNPWAASAVTPDCFTPPIRQNRNIKFDATSRAALDRDRNLLLFFELEWLKFDDTIANRLIEDPALEAYRHYLQSLRRYRPHTLSEPEEKVINERDNTGRNAFGRLFSEITSSLTFTFEKHGKKADLNLSQILSLLHEPDRDAAAARHGDALSRSCRSRAKC